MRSVLTLTGILLAASTQAAAAQTTYATGRDTLRYREVTQGKILITSPEGEMPFTIKHDAIVAVARTRGDTARGWYDSLSVALSGPSGTQQPASGSALHLPFVLRLDPRGRVTVVSAPTFPKSFEGVSDLVHQFDDFFLRLPAQPLTVGLAWSDTMSLRDSTAEKSLRRSWFTNYRVERDTVVGGMPALVIRTSQQQQLNGEGPVPNQPMRMQFTSHGTAEGFFVFAPRAGRLLSRRREGELAGDVTVHAPDGPMTIMRSFTYTSTMDALPR